MNDNLNCFWWTIRTKPSKSGGVAGIVVREFSIDKHSEPLPPAVEHEPYVGKRPRKGGYYAVGRGVEAKDGEYPLGPFKSLEAAKVAALADSL